MVGVELVIKWWWCQKKWLLLWDFILQKMFLSFVGIDFSGFWEKRLIFMFLVNKEYFFGFISKLDELGIGGEKCRGERKLI